MNSLIKKVLIFNYSLLAIGLIVSYFFPEKKERIEEPQIYVEEEIPIEEIYAKRILSLSSLDINEARYISSRVYFYSQKYNVDYNYCMVIINTESDFKYNAYNKNGKAYGLCQITKPCLEEFNKNNKTKYILNDMLNIELNLEVGIWYISYLENHYKIQNNEDSYIAYNIGITKFNKMNNYEKELLRNGIYPMNMYGFKKGEVYRPIKRYYAKLSNWS